MPDASKLRRKARWSKRKRRLYPPSELYEMEKFSDGPSTDVTLWMGTLLEFVPELDVRDKEAYETCAKVMGQRNILAYYAFKNRPPGESHEDAPYPQYMMFAREVAGAIREAENIDACTFEAINDRVNQKSILGGFPETKDLHFQIARLIEEMTLLEGFYKFLPRRQESEKPTVDYSFLNEIVQSFEAIFPDDKSRKHFLQVEKPKLDGQDVLDPYLLELCGEAPKDCLLYLVEFRIFRRRLTILEDFAKTAVPKRGRSLWKDQRNLEKSITFKAVIVFGSLGVVIGLIQIILSILQVAYAIKAT